MRNTSDGNHRRRRGRRTPFGVFGALGGFVLLLAGCAASRPMEEAKLAQHARLETDIVGRWTGDPVDAPAAAWWAGARFDLSFSDGGDFSAIARTFARKPHELRFEGGWKLANFLGGSALEIDERSLGGRWTVSRTGADAITIERDELKIALRKRYGS